MAHNGSWFSDVVAFDKSGIAACILCPIQFMVLVKVYLMVVLLYHYATMPSKTHFH